MYLSSPDDIKDAFIIGYSGPGYYFWDETDAGIIGPYTSLDEVRVARLAYAEALNKYSEKGRLK